VYSDATHRHPPSLNALYHRCLQGACSAESVTGAHIKGELESVR